MTLTPPEPDPLVLTPPEPVAAIPVERAATLVPIADATRSQLEERAATFVDSIADLDPRTPEFLSRVNSVSTLGDSDVRASAQVTNRMLDRSLSTLAGAKGEGADAQQRVGKNLVELRRVVEDLDPGDPNAKGRKLLSKLPFGNKLRDLVSRYQSANTNITKIVTALRSGQDELRRDNAAIQGERTRLWDTMGKLQEYAVLAQALDAAVEAKIATISDPQHADALRADVLFPVRQKYQDLLVQLAVCAQGYLAMDTIRRSNDELIKGVERASTTTVSALRVAVTIAQALANQKMVIEQVTALKGTTEDLIRSNAAMLAAQSGQIQQIAADPAVGVATLKAAFDQIYTTLDSIDTFKARAVESMSTTVETLNSELQRSSAYLERSRRTELEG
ncbi:toxic anion resistance protein [Cryptosporangium phraense]|uniref:Toxic anion resistance protein n=1 Tax=Cryptosporangium phraense TaxID=2593070 RepID=A0A545AMZ5_9ACTN|nr:toxic anion resistance protein [Cryptosporangium phraense]TQS42653.1 toxic anion resistance protein [Cryptosporangium phraense]